MQNISSNQRFLDPEKVLFRAGLKAGETVADLGAGSGFYALAAGKVVGPNGKVWVVDVLETALDHVAADARVRQLKNIQTLRADLETANSLQQISSAGCDLVVFGNIMHQIKDLKNILAEAFRILKTGSKLLVVDWNEKPGPLGPAQDQRIKESDVKKTVSASGFKFESEIETDSYHFGLIFTK